jgi:membrane-associated phospholipid phosphatase
MIAPYLVWALMCFVGAGVIAYAVTTNWDSMMDSDQNIGQYMFDIARNNEVVANAAWIWHTLGTTNVLMPIILVVGLILLATKHWGFALYLACTSLGGVLISELAKHAVERERPVWPDPLFTETGFSFPSGHAMAGIYAWAVFGIIAVYLFRGWPGTVACWVLIVFGLLMAPSRLLLGVHWTSDVVAGWLLALGWVLIVTSGAILLSSRRQKRRLEADAQDRSTLYSTTSTKGQE